MNPKDLHQAVSTVWRKIFSSKDPPVATKPELSNPYCASWNDDKKNMVESILMLETALEALKQAWASDNERFTHNLPVKMYGDGKGTLISVNNYQAVFKSHIVRCLEIDLGDTWYPHGQECGLGFKLSLVRENWMLDYPNDPHFFYDDLIEGTEEEDL